EMLAGRKPFKGETPTATIVQILREDPPALDKLVPGIPPRLVAAVKRALAKEPGDRFPAAGEFGRELQIIRRSIQAAASDAHGLDETRFASSSEMAALHQQLEQDAAAKSASTTSTAPQRKWAVPVIAAAVLLVGVAALTLKMGGTPADGATAATSVAASGGAAAGSAAAASTDPVIRIESTPPGAELVLNGQPTGEVTPAPVTFTGPGPHTLRLSRRGFVSQEVSLTAADLKAPSLRYTLAAAEVPKVPVNITSAYPVAVMVGRETLASSGVSHSLSVPSGTRLRIVSGEYLLDAAVVVSGRAVAYTSPPLGKLTVLTKFETCKVKIGDRMLGFPPITRMPIVAGQYRIDIVCDSGNNPPGVFVTVGANDTATARIQ
ncbi:MAG: PEGA domain-containing protein, partial [Acidobacteriota bacterium]|nr:PEGA domain-containing protein [Acidobacteriota bacterium]